MNRFEQDSAVYLRVALRLWTAVTALFVIGSLTLYLFMGRKVFDLLIQTGPLSIREQTLICVAIAWLSLGIAIVFLRRSELRPERCVEVVCSLVILFLYINILRERVAYGDVGDYVRAAVDLHLGRPFGARYIYPPFLATLCQPLLPIGQAGLAALFWFANVVSLVAFFWLLKAVLVRYGFGRILSLGIVFLFLIVNVPILRTLVYVQINLHVINLILLAILFFPRHPILSALALAVAAHLKASPLVLALPFLCTRDRKWTASFLLGMIGLAGVTVVSHGWSPFTDFLHNAGDIYSANAISFRENSVDSLVRSTALLGGADLSRAVVLLFKIPVLILIFWTAVRNSRHATFVRAGEPGSGMLNSVPAFLILMLLASPLMWVHHPVLVAIPFLLIVKKLNTPSAWVWYSFAYALEFLAPTFDFYPWSFGRLISPLILTLLLVRFSDRGDADWFLSLRDQLESISRRRDRLPGAPAEGEKTGR